MNLPAELAHHVDELPTVWRTRLARGPLADRPTRQRCRVCQVLLKPAYDYVNGLVGNDTADHIAGAAALALHDWHQAVLGDSCAHLPDLTHGPAAYARCCAIYRAAGWQPDDVA